MSNPTYSGLVDRCRKHGGKPVSAAHVLDLIGPVAQAVDAANKRLDALTPADHRPGGSILHGDEQ